MVQVLEREKSLRDRVITIKPTARVEMLRQRYLDTKDKAVIDLLRIRTRVWKETEGQPAVTRHAKAFAAIVREMPVNIYPDELFVGWLFCEPRGSNITWYQTLELIDDLDTLNTRKITPFLISDEDKRELREEIIPYWLSHLDGGAPRPHWTAGYEKVLKKGILGIKQDAEERIARLDLTQPEDFKKQTFLQGVILALEAAAEIGTRFATKARELADSETSNERKAELLKIAEVCDHAPAYPARTFYEAIQSVWFVHILHALDNEHATGMGPGRPDQYLYPYYERDIAEGRITKEQAQEFIDCWFMRYSQYYMFQPKGGLSAHSPGHHLDVGGMKPDGTDASNELSYMFLEALMHTTGMTEPTLGLLVHSKTPEALLIKACQLTALGGGYPMYINQDHRIQCLLARNEMLDGPPITLALARTGTGAGCHELVLPDMESGFYITPLFVVGALALVLSGGKTRPGAVITGIDTGDPRQFTSFDEVKEAFRKQVAHMVRQAVISSHNYDMALAPKAFNSALVEDCIEKGLSKGEGGARYTVTSFQTFGRVDIANSLAAIKKLVFDEKKITMAELCDALEHNFEGYEDIRRMCLESPKFGNDDDFVDEQLAWINHVVNSELKQYKGLYGGCVVITEVPMAGYIPAGRLVGALPSGRLAGEPLGDAATPTAGSAVNGPTAILKSFGKVNNAEINQGQTLNMRIDSAVFKTDEGFKRLADLIRVFVDERVDHVQINVVSSDTLKAAQREPEKYRDLTVKVAGYNARFVEINKILQDNLIARTEYGL